MATANKQPITTTEPAAPKLPSPADLAKADAIKAKADAIKAKEAEKIAKAKEVEKARIAKEKATLDAAKAEAKASAVAAKEAARVKREAEKEAARVKREAEREAEREAARAAREAAGVKERVVAADLSRYHFDKEKRTAGGNVSVDCNDPIAEQLRGLPLDAVYGAAVGHLGVPKPDLIAKYSHLNVGMQRMNLGNRIRAAVKVAAGE